MIRTLLAAALGCAAVAFALDQPAAPAPHGVGQKVAAPLTALDGKAVALDAVRGKAATVVVFVSTECPVSNSYSGPLNDLAKAYGGKGVAVLAVYPGEEGAAAVAKWAKEYKVAVPVYLDPKKEAVRAFAARITPEAFVLDAEGAVRYRGRIDDAYSERLKRNATVTSHDLTNAVEDVLAGKPVRVAVTKAVGCAIDLGAAPAAKAGEVTYYKDVAPILQRHCQNCHRPGEIGPFSLVTYQQARQWSADIKQYTASRQMPPWMPGGGVPMKGERKLTEKEIATLAAWADAGAPEGDPKDAPPPAQFPDGWAFGKPDLVLAPADDFHVGATGPDVFRCFVVPTGLTEDRWVIGYAVKPGNPRIVHHTLHFFDTSGTARELERKQQAKEKGTTAADRGPGYSSSMGVGFVPPARGSSNVPWFGGVGGWAPGQAGQFLPQGAGWFLPKGSDFIIQTHYHRDGKPGTDRTQVGLYFAKGPVDQPWQTIVINGMKAWEKIPAGKSDYTTRGAVYLHTDAILHGAMPHMHLLGKTTKITMTLPDGKPVVLVDIPAWDYRWQETYMFREPILAKAGTKLEIEATFDNSEANPNNPVRPPQDVTVGEQTSNEMLYAFIGATSTKTPYERLQMFAYPPSHALDGVVTSGEITPILERRLGNWDGSVKLTLGDAKPIELNGVDAVEKSANGKYIKGKTTNDADRRGAVTLTTYDPVRKQYRLWLFDAQGTALEFTGTHDEQANSLTWTATPQEGVVVTMVWTFPTADTFDMTITATAGGKQALAVEGKMKRKK